MRHHQINPRVEFVARQARPAVGAERDRLAAKDRQDFREVNFHVGG